MKIILACFRTVNLLEFHLWQCYQCYIQKIECKAIMEALNYKTASKTFRRFVYDSHARFQERSHADKFLEIINKEDPVISSWNLKSKTFTKFSRH